MLEEEDTRARVLPRQKNGVTLSAPSGRQFVPPKEVITPITKLLLLSLVSLVLSFVLKSACCCNSATCLSSERHMPNSQR